MNRIISLETKYFLRVSVFTVIVSIFAMFLIYGYKYFSVWSASMTGQAELKQAEWNRQIKIKEAEATLSSAKYLAQAEIERAKGVANANKIIGDSLRGNEEYLRYLWIHNLAEGKNEVIYIPTEANLPILEANRKK